MVIVQDAGGSIVQQPRFTLAHPESQPQQPSESNVKAESTDPLPTFTFVVVWLLSLALHGLCATYLLAMALLYYFMENPLMAYYTNLLALPKHRCFRLFGFLVGILGALHGLQLVLHLVWTIKSRAPAVFPRAAMVNRMVKALVGLKRKRKAAQPVTSRLRRSLSSFSSISSFTAAGLQEVLSVKGNHFALIFTARKAVEVSAQIVQCHRYSTLIGRVWINQAYAAMVVVNCWITPILDYLMLSADSRVTKHATARNISKADIAVSIRERTICVTVDTLLTTIGSIVLPLAIFIPYAQVFDAQWFGFPMEMLYGDVSFPNLIRENQALFALNFIDGVTKLVPHLSILFGMASISLLLEAYAPQQFKHNGKPRVRYSVTNLIAAQSKPQDTDTMKPATPAHIVGLTFMRRVLTPLGFLAAGAIVLGLHLHAAHLASTADAAIMKMCLQTLRPWFAENVSCSVLEFNCYRHGVLSPASDALDHLQNDAVTAIVFEHCPEFEMPSSIRRFHNLLGVELWNVSIVKWDVDSALSANLHPSMIYLVMVYTNMTEMPQGLLTRPLPPLLGDIEISITNLTRIPDELAEAWENVRLVYLEHAPLKEFPTALFQIPSLSVSLIDDGLESVPEDLFTTVSLLDEYLEIAFSYNPIKSLPKSIRDGLLINYLSIDHTELTDLPAWVDGVGQWINLGGSSICNATKPEVPKLADCTDWGWNPMADGRYPLSIVTPLRAIQEED
ncbi:hypothetical protein PRIC1_002644 [Phytophthora ramorum]